MVVAGVDAIEYVMWDIFGIRMLFVYTLIYMDFNIEILIELKPMRITDSVHLYYE